MLVLTPTRELALQVEESVRTYGRQRPVMSAAIYGGVGFDGQVRRLRQGPEVVVATPGRLLDHVNQRTIDLSRVEVLVLDEADRMLDMGFIHDIRKILALLPVQRQNLLFSATFSPEIRRLAADFLKDPAFVQVTPKNIAAELVTQIVMPVDKSRKRELLSQLVKSGRIYQALVFTRTKHGADRLAEQLGMDGISAIAIHGNKSQPQRVRALNDVQAEQGGCPRRDRHRRARPGHRRPSPTSSTTSCRWSRPTTCTASVAPAAPARTATRSRSCASTSSQLLADIERLLGHRIDVEIIPGFEPNRSIRPQPIQLRSAGHQGRLQNRPQNRGPRTDRPPQRWNRDRRSSRATTLPGERLSRP